MNIDQIMRLLPHRYPFLLVDRILEMSEGFVAGQKCVSINEPFFQGHFPGRPVMPGVLLIEAMAQTGAVLAKSEPGAENKLLMLVGVDNVRFRKPVFPGDVLRLEMRRTYNRRSLGKGHGRVLVNGEVVCEAEITWSLVDE